MKVFFLLHEQTVHYLQEPAFTELVKPFLCSGRVTSHRICVYQRRFRELRHRLIEKRLDALSREVNGKPVVVYGAGELTRQIWPLLTGRLHVAGLADRQFDQKAQDFPDVPVIPPQRIPEYAGCVVISVLASRDEIEGDLHRMFNEEISILPFLTQDALCREVYEPLETEIMAQIASDVPDLVVWAFTFAGENLRGELFEKIKRACPEVKIYTQWWDYNDGVPELSKLERESLRLSDMVGIIDSHSRYRMIRNREAQFGDYPNVERLSWHPTLFDPDLYKRENLPKVYDVAIIGSAEGERVRYVDFLSRHFKNRFHHFGGIRTPEKCLDRKQYVRLMNQTKICVNTQTSPQRIQMKGRVREALSVGAFLLESDNAETRAFAVEGQGIVYYRDCIDLKEKIEFYLREDAAREKIAEEGYLWYHNHFSAEKWVDEIGSRCGL